MRRHLLPLSFVALSLAASGAARAGEISHYPPGGPNVRDFMVPSDTGLYVSSYNFYYQSGRLNDSHGDEGPFPGTPFFPDVDVYMTAIPLLLVQKQAIGEHIDYGFLVSPTFGNTSVTASLNIDGQNPVLDDSEFGLGDLYVQPFWLSYAPLEEYRDKFFVAGSWGFWAPTGSYGTHLQGSDPEPDTDNIGLGFWTNQFRLATQLNPLGKYGPALVVAGTYEVNSEKEDLDFTPGDHFTLNWGISQFLPFGINDWYPEIGVTGYDSWQVTSDRGTGRRDALQDEAHAAGFQVGITETQCFANVNFHYTYEYEAEERLQGHTLGLSFTLHFKSGEKLRFSTLQSPKCSSLFAMPRYVPPPKNGE